LKNRWIYKVLTVAVLAVFLYHCAMVILQNINEEAVTVRITDKMRVSYGSTFITQKYLIYTVDADGRVAVFENTDSFPWRKFNSSDFFASLATGETYRLRVVGFRIPVLSKYRNIIGIEQVDEGERILIDDELSRGLGSAEA